MAVYDRSAKRLYEALMERQLAATDRVVMELVTGTYSEPYRPNNQHIHWATVEAVNWPFHPEDPGADDDE